MDKAKYTAMKKAIILSLNENDELSHTELAKAIKSYFQKNKIRFNGSIEWHMEWVKLDLEANKFITRINDRNKTKFSLMK